VNNDIYVMYVYCQVHCAVWLGLLKFFEYIKLEVAKINDKTDKDKSWSKK